MNRKQLSLNFYKYFIAGYSLANCVGSSYQTNNFDSVKMTGDLIEGTLVAASYPIIIPCYLTTKIMKKLVVKN